MGVIEMVMSQTALDMIDNAFDEVNRLWKEEGITNNDYDIFLKESGLVMKRIDEIEEIIKPGMSDGEVKEYLDKWIKNWKLVFSRRKFYRDKEKTKGN